jgi:hypothetical protein
MTGSLPTQPPMLAVPPSVDACSVTWATPETIATATS